MSFLEITLFALFAVAVLLVGYCSYVYAGLRGTDNKVNGQSDKFFLWAIVGGVFGGTTLFQGLELGWSPFFIVLCVGAIGFAVGMTLRHKRTQ